MNKLIYLAGPYSHNPDEAYLLHLRYTAELLKQKYLVFSPIVHNHYVAKLHNLPTGNAFWAKFNWGMLAKCDELWVMLEAGWRESEGTQFEINVAKENNIPISYVVIYPSGDITIRKEGGQYVSESDYTYLFPGALTFQVDN